MRIRLWRELLQRAMEVEGERLNRVLRRLEMLWAAMTDEERDRAEV